jgi:PTH1 family peptidyl-tRNA hydrolase
LGVGEPPPDVDLADWVLGPFTADERAAVAALVARAADAVLQVVDFGVLAALPAINAPPPA